MNVDACHPMFHEFVESWHTMDDCYQGPRRIKSRGPQYLPPTEGMIRDGAFWFSRTNSYIPGARGLPFWGDGYQLSRDARPGERRYWYYLKRAIFPDFVKEAVSIALGVMHHKPPTIELPTQLQGMLEKAGVHGEDMQTLLRSINVQQLIFGRLGLMLDMPGVEMLRGQEQLRILIYRAPQIINWDEGARVELTLPKLNLVVLNESEPRREGFEWRDREQWRVLMLGDVDRNEPTGVYSVGVFDEDSRDFNPALMSQPRVGANTLDEIPFVFVNTQDHEPTPDEPPLMGVADTSLAIYRGEADYRQALHEQANATLVIIAKAGDPEDAQPLGPGASINCLLGGDAKYISAPADGLGAMRQSIADDRMHAANKAGQLIDSRSGQKEGAETLRIRVAAQTATLNQIALTAASGLERILKIAARWFGADEEKVVVQPNLDFDGAQMTGEELLKLVTAKSMGAKLSHRSIHRLMRDGDLTELTLEEEEAEIEGEEPMPRGPGAQTDVDEDEDQDDDEDEPDEDTE